MDEAAVRGLTAVTALVTSLGGVTVAVIGYLLTEKTAARRIYAEGYAKRRTELCEQIAVAVHDASEVFAAAEMHQVTAHTPKAVDVANTVGRLRAVTMLYFDGAVNHQLSHISRKLWSLADSSYVAGEEPDWDFLREVLVKALQGGYPRNPDGSVLGRVPEGSIRPPVRSERRH